MTALAKPLFFFCFSQNFEPGVTFQRWHSKLAAERGLPWRQFYFVNQIVSLNREIRMAREAHPQKQIAAFPATGASFTLTRQANTLPLVHPLRDFDLITFDLVGIAAAQG